MTRAVIADARLRAARLYRAPGFRKAYLAGAAAADAGLSETACPYRRGIGTWRRTYRVAWLRGYRSVTPDVG